MAGTSCAARARPGSRPRRSSTCCASSGPTAARWTSRSSPRPSPPTSTGSSGASTSRSSSWSWPSAGRRSRTRRASPTWPGVARRLGASRLRVALLNGRRYEDFKSREAWLEFADHWRTDAAAREGLSRAPSAGRRDREPQGLANRGARRVDPLGRQPLVRRVRRLRQQRLVPRGPARDRRRRSRPTPSRPTSRTWPCAPTSAASSCPRSRSARGSARSRRWSRCCKRPAPICRCAWR